MLPVTLCFTPPPVLPPISNLALRYYAMLPPGALPLWSQ